MNGAIDPGFVKALQAQDGAAVPEAQPVTPPKPALFPLASPAATAGLPKAEDGPETTDRELVTASFDREAIDRNFWSIRERRVKDKRDALLRDVSQAVFGTDEGYRLPPVSAADMGAPTFGFPAPSTLRDLSAGDVTNARQERAAIVAMMDRLTELKAERPGELANLPSTLEELEQIALDQARGELQGERAEAERAIGNRANDGLIDTTGDLALQFLGGGAAAVSDVEGIALLPFGAGATTLGRAILIEGALGAVAEGVTLPAYNQQAEFLGTEAPDPVMQILFGAAVGAALPVGGRVISMGANTLTPAGRVRNRELLRFGLRPNAAPRERFASGQLAKGEAAIDTAPAVLPLETHQDNLDSATRAIEADQPVIVRPSDIVPDVTRQDQPGTVRQVLDLIRDHEARGSYDTVSDFIAPQDRPPRPITQMTINQVIEWQSGLIGRTESTAAGGYQFLRGTLADLVKREGLTGNELFDGSMQDRLAITLMRDAGLDAFQRGEISPAEFGNGLAKIWAALPVIPDTPVGRPDFRGPILPGFQRMEDDLQGKIRDIPVSVPYQRTVSAIVRALGPDLDIRVTSGAQAQPGQGPRTGSHRHDVDANGEGHTADLVLVRNGREVLPGDDPELYARFFEMAAPYFPGMGHYDWGIHVGGGKPAFWGPDTTSATANPLFADAYNRGRAAGTATGQSYYEGDGLNSALISVDRFYHVLSVPGAYTAFESGAVHRFPVASLKVDPETYQYKASDEQGLTDRLQNEREWDPAAAIGVMVHERLDGQMYIADGHQRFGLAKRLSTPESPIALEGHLYREADGYTPEMMRVKAAIRNIRGETGTPLDAAKIIRDYPEMVAGISRSRGFMLQADGLAQLAPGPYRAIVNEVIPQNYAAVVGRIMPRDEEFQKAAIAAIKRADPPNVLQAEAIARDIRRLGLERRADAAQGSLFGDEFDLGETAIRERARVLDAVNRELRANKAVFTKLTREGQRIEEAGNVLDQAENLNRQQLAQRALERLFLLSDEPGPVQDAIDAAAKRVRAGDPVASVVDDILTALDSDGAAGGRAAREADGIGGAASAADDDLKPIDRLSDLEPAEAAALQFTLKSRQSIRDIDDLMMRGARNHDELTREIAQAAQRAGVTARAAPVKGRARTEEKIQNKYAGDLNRVTDVARGGVDARTPEAADEFVKALARRYRVVDEGWNLVEGGYFDRKLMVVFDDGQLGEVQIWVPGMFEVKEAKGHKLYEIYRDMTRSEGERMQALADMEVLYQGVMDQLPPQWRSLFDQADPGIDAPSRSMTAANVASETSGDPSSARTSDAFTSDQVPSDASSFMEPGSGSIAGMDRSTRKYRMGGTSIEDIAAPNADVNLPDPDQRATGMADLFADPVESPTDAAMLTRIEDDVRARLEQEPDLFMAMEAPSTDPTVSRDMPVSDLLADIDGDREFIEQLNLCNPKGA